MSMYMSVGACTYGLTYYMGAWSCASEDKDKDKDTAHFWALGFTGVPFTGCPKLVRLPSGEVLTTGVRATPSVPSAGAQTNPDLALATVLSLAAVLGRFVSAG